MEEVNKENSSFKQITDILAKNHPNLNSAPDKEPEPNIEEPHDSIKDTSDCTSKS